MNINKRQRSVLKIQILKKKDSNINEVIETA